VYSDPLQRKGLEADLSVNRKLTIVAPEEAQIPWELLYQGDMATEDATSPGSPAFSPAPPIEWGRFWGGQYTIARPVATPAKTEVAIAASPLYVSLGVDKDLPSAEEVQSGFRPMIGQGSVELAIVNEMNALRQSW
jgi:hypothetical protein